MLTYNELVDLVEKVDPEKIETKVNEAISEGQQETKEYVDEKIDSIKKLYRHHITTVDSGKVYIINIDNTIAEEFTLSTLGNWLYNKGIRTGGDSSPYNAISSIIESDTNIYYFGVYSSNGTDVRFNRQSGGSVVLESIRDSVTEL